MNQQIQRIRQMEAHLNQISEAVWNLTAALEAYEKVVPRLAELDAYYGSVDWFADLDADLPLDLCCIGMERALSALGEVDGRELGEEIVAEIFSRFCVGK